MSTWGIRQHCMPRQGWRVRRVVDLVRLTNGFPFPSETFGPDGEIPLVRIRDLLSPDFGTFLQGVAPKEAMIHNGDVVIGMDGDFNLTVWKRGPAALNQRLCALRPREDIDIRFIAYSLPHILTIVNDLTFATTVKHLSSSDILGERLLIPPLAEQQRIADFLDAETARIDQLFDLQREVQGRLREREDSYVEAHFVRTGLAWKPLAALTDASRPIMYGIVLPGPHAPDGIPIVKGGDVAANRLHPDLLSRTSRDIEGRYVRSRLQGGDLVFAIRGSVGEVSVVPDSLSGANLTQDAARISIGQGTDTHWLQIVLRAPSVKQQVEARVTGATIRGINIWDLKRILVPTPSKREQINLVRSATRATSKSCV